MNIEDRLVALFAEHSDHAELCERVSEVLAKEYDVERVRVVLRREAQEFQAIDTGESSVYFSAIRNYFSQYPGQFMTYVENALPSHILTYMRTMHIHCIVPLHVKDKLIGWLECIDSERPYVKVRRRAVRSMQRIQPILSIAFHRVMLDLKFHERIEQLVALNRISQTMNSSLNVQETLEAVMDSVVDLLHVDRALMYLLDEKREYVIPRIGRGMGKDISLDFKVDITKSIFADIIRHRAPLIVEDVATDPRVNQEYAKNVQTKAFVVVPMVSKEQVIGIIGVDNLFSGKPVNEINTELLVTLANAAAIALTNSRLYEEVNHFNQVLQHKVNEATEDLLALLEMKSHFLTVASHQLRTPTTIIKGMLSMIVEDPELPQHTVREFVQKAYVSTSRLERIVSELLSATELEHSHIVPAASQVSIHDVVTEVAKHLDPLAAQRGNTITLNLPEESISIETDKFKLQEALSNTIDNAIRYTTAGTITISVMRAEDGVLICIQDTGIGIAPEDKELIFEKFRRGANGIAMDPNGTGLGLYIVRRIIDVLQGSVELHSEGEQRGALCVIRLPLSLKQN